MKTRQPWTRAPPGQSRSVLLTRTLRESTGRRAGDRSRSHWSSRLDAGNWWTKMLSRDHHWPRRRGLTSAPCPRQRLRPPTPALSRPDSSSTDGIPCPRRRLLRAAGSCWSVCCTVQRASPTVSRGGTDGPEKEGENTLECGCEGNQCWQGQKPVSRRHNDAVR